MRVHRSSPAPSAGSAAADAGATRTLTYEPALDGLRGLSVAAVVLFHACATSSLAGWVKGGGLGVSVFFTLSGFLITTILLREAGGHDGVDLRRFWARRIRRLAPASLAAVTLVVALGRTALLDVRAQEAAATVWSFANWNVVAEGADELLRTIVGPLGPTWSLAVEEQFYVLLALVVVGCIRLRHPQRVLAVIFGGAIAASVLLSHVVSDWHPRLEFGTDVRAGELATGGLLALAVARWPTSLTARTRAVDAAGALALVTLGTLFMTADYTPPWLLRGGFAAVAVVSATIIVAALAHGAVATVLGARPLVALGRWSYSVYLVHWPVILVLTEDRVGVGSWALVVAKCGVAVSCGVLLHLAVEQPFRRARDPSLVATLLAWIAASVAVTLLAVALA